MVINCLETHNFCTLTGIVKAVLLPSSQKSNLQCPGGPKYAPIIVQGQADKFETENSATTITRHKAGLDTVYMLGSASLVL